jgi:KTSC domain-containing protein
VPSTLIQKATYNETTRVLSIWFVPNGRRYDYHDVSPETYTALRSAYSKGRYFNNYIRDRYTFRLVKQTGQR